MPEINCPNHASMVKEIDRYNDNQQEIVKGQHEIRERLAEVVASAKSAHHRIDGLAEHSEAVIRLAISVENVVKQNDEILKQLGKHDVDITDLKMARGRSLEDYFRHGVKYLIGGIIAYLLMIATKGGTL